MNLTATFRTLLLTCLLLGSRMHHLSAQRTCGTATIASLTATPQGLSRHLAYEARLRGQMVAQSGARTAQASFVIPTVIHVIQETSTNEISDACILSQMDVINEDFQRLNGDTSQIPTDFLPVLGNAGIQFCLASKDPDGNPTSGINRIVSPLAVHNKATQEDSLKGLIQWPPTRYLNIWVVKDMGGLLGYATFPEQLVPEPHRDGVVLSGPYFGTGSCAFAPFNKGRTATHELGHWLGLRHTFTGGCVGTTPTNCAFSGDNICDTPPVSSSSFGCPDPKNTCTESPSDMNDMTMNFMDYVNDACMHMFTAGQASRMQAVLGSERSGLSTTANLDSTGCTPVVGRPEPGTGTRWSFAVGPNPFSDRLDVRFSAATKIDLQFEIANLFGKVVYRATESVKRPGEGEVVMEGPEIAALPSGIYFLRGSSELGSFTQRLLKVD